MRKEKFAEISKPLTYMANVHQLSSEERQSHLIRARACPLDNEALLQELHRLIRNTKVSKRLKWYK